MNDKSKIIDKIKKCLRLSASSNEHEAAAALRQAQKLMAEYDIDHADIDAADVYECHAKSNAKSKPSAWETRLSSHVAKAFGCQMLFAEKFDSGEWRFIGMGAGPDIAKYAFTVLLRQAKRARAEYIKTKLKRCKTATKTSRADLFSTGWVMGAVNTLQAFAGSPERSGAISIYMAKKYTSVQTFDPRDRNSNRKQLRDHEYNDMHAGRQSGKDAELNRGVAGHQQAAIGFSS